MQVTWSGNEVDDHELYDSYESKDKNNLVVFAAFIMNSNYDSSKKINQNDKNKFDFFLFLFLYNIHVACNARKPKNQR